MSEIGAEASGDDVVSGCGRVKLTEADIPGASLSEPLETHTIPELKWWLLYRGIQIPISWKKAQIISKYMCMSFF